jgi:hypothetical protein
VRPTKLILYQDDPFNQAARKLVYATILRHSPIPSDFGTEEDVRQWMVLRSKYSDHGEWRLGANSVTDTVDTAYTVGTSANQSNKFWGLSPRLQELHFCERQTMPMSGTFDETVVETVVTVTLHEAWYGTNGLVSNAVLLRDKPGNGFVRVPSNILKPGLVHWERLTD